MTSSFCQNLKQILKFQSKNCQTSIVQATHLFSLIFNRKFFQLGKWVLHDLFKANCKSGLDICFSLRSCELIESFLDRLATGDGKWFFYPNLKCCRHRPSKGEKTQPQQETEFHAKQVFLSTLSDCKEVIYFELLLIKATINAQFICQQLESFNTTLKGQKIESEWCFVGTMLFHRDNCVSSGDEKSCHKRSKNLTALFRRSRSFRLLFVLWFTESFGGINSRTN